ncbi:MAG TPA: DUF559 domain-containing protein [Solirubrobacterales bacterium]|nr:DUF559 domain-containing protein [Solirubrobacterales bacterium]
MGERAINFAIAHGRLYPVFRGAFGVGHEPLRRHGRLLAAVLACGDGTVLSHGTAASLMGLWEKEPVLIDVVAPGEAGRGFDGIRRRHTPPPKASERWLFDGIPCVTPARAIVDVAGMVGIKSLGETVEQAAVEEMLNIPAIDRVLAGPRRRGSRGVRLVLADWRRYPRGLKVRSRLEARLLPLLTQWRIPIPRVNSVLRVGGERYELDFLWPSHRLVVETDGGKYHGNPVAQARDSERNAILRANGYEVRRITWGDLEARRSAVRAELRRLLAPAARA